MRIGQEPLDKRVGRWSRRLTGIIAPVTATLIAADLGLFDYVSEILNTNSLTTTLLIGATATAGSFTRTYSSNEVEVITDGLEEGVIAHIQTAELRSETDTVVRPLDWIEPTNKGSDVESGSPSMLRQYLMTKDLIGVSNEERMELLDGAERRLENMETLEGYLANNPTATRSKAATDLDISASEVNALREDLNSTKRTNWEFSVPYNQRASKALKDAERAGRVDKAFVEGEIAEAYVNSKTGINAGNADLVAGKAEKLQTVYEGLQEGMTKKEAMERAGIKSERTADSYLVDIRDLTGEEDLDFKIEAPVLKLEPKSESVEQEPLEQPPLYTHPQHMGYRAPKKTTLGEKLAKAANYVMPFLPV